MSAGVVVITAASQGKSDTAEVRVVRDYTEEIAGQYRSADCPFGCRFAYRFDPTTGVLDEYYVLGARVCFDRAGGFAYTHWTGLYRTRLGPAGVIQEWVYREEDPGPLGCQRSAMQWRHRVVYEESSATERDRIVISVYSPDEYSVWAWREWGTWDERGFSIQGWELPPFLRWAGYYVRE